MGPARTLSAADATARLKMIERRTTDYGRSSNEEVPVQQSQEQDTKQLQLAGLTPVTRACRILGDVRCRGGRLVA
jgi:hypothetical protein